MWGCGDAKRPLGKPPCDKGSESVTLTPALPTHAQTQNGKSSSSGGGASSSGGPSQGGGASRTAGAERRVAEGGYGLGEPSRAGQMSPSHPGPPRSRGLLRHLKSGARGLRLDSRSSHIAPPQIGQRGIPLASTPPRAPPVLVGAATVAWGRGALPPVAADGALGAPVVAPRGGQITPPHAASLHLKSGALGFRFPSRLSHIGPWHLGQVGGEGAAPGVLG